MSNWRFSIPPLHYLECLNAPASAKIWLASYRVLRASSIRARGVDARDRYSLSSARENQPDARHRLFGVGNRWGGGVGGAVDLAALSGFGETRPQKIVDGTVGGKTRA